MRIDRQILLAFLVILAIVMVGFIANLHFLFKMVEAQEKVDEEWAELNAMVDVQKIVAKISDEVDRAGGLSVAGHDLTWDINLLQDKLQKMSSELSEEEDVLTLHHQKEENYFEEFVSGLEGFVGSLPKDRSRVSRWMPDAAADQKISLLKAERAGYQLQQADMAEMMEATRQAEMFRREMIRWSLSIFIILVAAIVAFAVWFAWLFRRKTDTLIRDEQLLTMAVMAQSLAHEIRNPLGIIKSSTSVLKNKVHHDAEGRELLGYLVEEVDRIDGLLKQLAHLSEGSAVHRTENISGIIEAVCAFMKPHAQKAGVEVVYTDQTAGFSISCNANQIKQLLINLIFNAIHASERGQTIFVDTLLEKNDYVLIVRDQGAGMDEKTRKKLFDPFFTTKSQGAGLGLVVVKKIVDWHQGRISVASAPGKGTTFKIHFPKDTHG